jgi:hypothetical protein
MVGLRRDLVVSISVVCGWRDGSKFITGARLQFFEERINPDRPRSSRLSSRKKTKRGERDADSRNFTFAIARQNEAVSRILR